MIRPALLAALLIGACAATTPPAPGRISVEVYQGLGGKAAGSFLPAVELIVDATPSMQASAAGATRLQAAQVKALDLIGSLPAGSLVALQVLGGAPGAECAPAERRVPLRPAADAVLAAAVRELRSEGEGSIAAALSALAAELESQGGARDARVVLITDLDPSCGGDLCAAAAALVAAGAWLDVAVLGEAPAPACLAALRPSTEQPGALIRALTRPAPTWRLVAPGSDSAVVSGTAGREVHDAPPGEWSVALDLERPAVVGPLPVAPGRLTRVRVLHFPGSAPRFAWEIAR